MARPKEFYVSFDTKEMPGKIVAVKVTIEQEIVSDKSKEFAINLSEHPLYRHLVTYVNSNPARG